MGSPRRLGRAASLLAWGYLGRSVAYLGLTLLLSRELGASGFGELSLFLALGYGMSHLAGSWPFLAVPILVGAGWGMAEAFRPALALAAAGALAAAVVVVPVSLALLDGTAVTIGLLLCLAAALVGLQGLYAVLQTQGRMGAIALTQTAERTLALALVLALGIVSALSVREAQAGIAAAAAVTCAGALLLVTRTTPLVRGARVRDRLPAVGRAVGPMAVVTACAYLVAWIDLLLLAAFVPDSEVGVYALAYQVYAFVATLGTLWIVAALPAHARDAAGGATVAALLPARTTSGASGLWSAGVAAVAVGCGALLPQVFGEEFRDATGPLMVLLASAAPLAVYFAAVPVVLAVGRARGLATISVAAVAINVGLDLLLIPPYGAWGPAFATAAQSLFATVAVLSLLRVDGAVSLCLACLPALAVTAVLAFDPSNPLLLAAAAVVALVVAVHSLRAFDGPRILATR